MLGIDDAHLLDRLSITLLQHLAASGAATLVLTVRTGLPAPDPAGPLWKDELATRIELLPLDRAQTLRLVAQALDGDVDTRTAERVWRLTRGAPLFVRELLEEGLGSGRLRPTEGLWRWHGDMVPSERLIEIVHAHMGSFEKDQWQALEVLAIAEPLSAGRLVELSSVEALADLERRRLVTDDAPASGNLRVVHPMYSAVVRGEVSQATMRLVLSDVDGRPGGRNDVVPAGSAAPDGRARAGPEALTAAARRALAQLDLAGAEQLAAAAVEAGGRLEALLILVEVVRWRGDAERSASLGVQAAGLVTTEGEQARLTAARALTLACGLGRQAEAAALLRSTARVVRSGEGRRLLASVEALVAVCGGDNRRAGRLAESMDGGPGEALAAGAAALGVAFSGQAGRALSLAAAGWSALESGRPVTEAVLARLALASAEVVALQLAGRTEELLRRTAEHHRRNLAVPEWAGDGIAALHCGWAALASGRPGEAVRWLVEAKGSLARLDPMRMRGLCHQLLAAARVLVGDTEGARRLLADPDEGTRDVVPALEPISGLARGCLTAAEGRVEEAGRQLIAAANRAAGHGQEGLAALLYHRALRLGRGAEVATPLRALADRLDAPLVEDFAVHAAAVARGDGDGLDQLSARFWEAGMPLWAADAAMDAAGAYERGGARRAAAECTARAVRMARASGIRDAPVLDLLSLPTLTIREEEVARLASRGLSNLDIADRLVVSVRTVEAHLSHIYTKFGITSRSQLVSVLATAGPERAARRRAPRSSLSGAE